MSSFRIMSRKTSFRLGVAVVIIIHIGFFYGFWRVKAGQIGNKVVELDIYSPKAAVGLAFYEALPTQDCVHVVNEQAPRLGMPVYVEPPPSAKNTESAKIDAQKSGAAETVADTANAAVATPAEAPAAPVEVKLEPSLHYASSPRCKGAAAIPAGAEKLGADGFVGLELNIDSAGVVQRGEIDRSSGFKDLDAAALKQVKENLIFKPCQKGSTIVGCKQYIKFRWKMGVN
jgi:TonB family protein